MPEYVGGVPKDPVTMVPYHYEPGAQTNSFIICATFSASSSQSTLNSPYTIPASQSSFYDWSHGIGEVCFNRTISPVDYPPISK
jgi:hypothetical protein